MKIKITWKDSSVEEFIAEGIAIDSNELTNYIDIIYASDPEEPTSLTYSEALKIEIEQ